MAEIEKYKYGKIYTIVKKKETEEELIYSPGQKKLTGNFSEFERLMPSVFYFFFVSLGSGTDFQNSVLFFFS